MFDGNSFGLRIEGGNDSVAQDGVSQGFHVVHGHVITSSEQCPDLRTQNQLLASSWSRSPLDQVLDPFGGGFLLGSRHPDKVENKIVNVLGDRYPFDGFLAFENGFSVQDRFEFGLESRGRPLEDLPFFVTGRIIDDYLEEEPIALSFGQVVSSFLLNRILGGQNKERLVQMIGFSAHRNIVLLHGLEQGRLRFGWSPVDFVGQNDL